MRKLILIVSILYPLGCAVAQRTIPKDDAAPPAPAAGNRPAASVDEVIGFYTNRREAALAAFRVGYEAAKSHKTSRAIDMFLEAVHRDPGFVKALYNLAVECAVDERWQDAKQFYETLHQREDLDAQMAGLVSAESRRVNAILDFESTAGGRQRRQFLIQFVPVFEEKDPYKAITRLQEIARKYPTEWEAPALLGELQARQDRFQSSFESLTGAARAAAAPAQKSKLEAAAKIAQNEVNFANQVTRAEEARNQARDQKQYESAAVQFEGAWKLKPARADLVMNAATSYLLADEVKPAVVDLHEARDGGMPDISRKAIAMLKALGPIDQDAAREAASPASPSSASTARSPADEISDRIGVLKTDEMVLPTKPAPDVMEERTATVRAIKDDQRAYTDTTPEFGSKDSIFEIYQRYLRESQPPQPPAATDTAAAGAVGGDAASTRPEPVREQQAPAAAEPVREQPAAAPEPVREQRPPALPARKAAGPQQAVNITTDPPGATVFVDERGQDGMTPQQCTSPCQLSLGVGSRHELRMTLAGYAEGRSILQVARGAQPPPFKLDRKGGTLFVKGATTVLIDGQPHSTDKGIWVSEGPHEVSVQTPGGITTRKVTVKDGDLQQVEVSPDKM
jgi:hypothetical protein